MSWTLGTGLRRASGGRHDGNLGRDCAASAACPLTGVIEDQNACGPGRRGRRLPDQAGLDAAVGSRTVDHRLRARDAAH